MRRTPYRTRVEPLYSEIKRNHQAFKNLHLNVSLNRHPDTMVNIQVGLKLISRHIKNIFEDAELFKKSNMHFLHSENSDKPLSGCYIP